MADELSMALLEPVRNGSGDVEFLREVLRMLTNAVLAAAVTAHVGAERHERTPERTGQQNGYRERQWHTWVGSIALNVPRVRDGSAVLVLLEPRKRAEPVLPVGGAGSLCSRRRSAAGGCAGPGAGG